jgi:hypothetical protein
LSADGFEAREVRLDELETGQDGVADRHGLLGLVALISLAMPALLIRTLLPDLNPLILTALGLAVYVAYLVAMAAVLWRQAEQTNPSLETVPTTAIKE